MFTFLFSFASGPLFADSSSGSSKTYDDITFPQWARDIRRTEIITFGSLPFVTLWTIVGYSMYEYGEFRNPLNKNTDSFTEDDQWKIIKISAATCVGLGLFDLTVNFIRRTHKESKLRKLREMQPFTIEKASEVQHHKMNEEESDEMAEERLKREMKREKLNPDAFFIEEVESAVF